MVNIFLSIIKYTFCIFIGYGVLNFAKNLERGTKKNTNTYSYELLAVVSDVNIEETGTNNKKVKKYYPVFKYNYCGNEYTAESEKGSTSCYITGQNVRILINPDDPQKYIPLPNHMLILNFNICKFAKFFGALFILQGIAKIFLIFI